MAERCEICEGRATNVCSGLDVPALYFCEEHAVEHAKNCPHHKETAPRSGRIDRMGDPEVERLRGALQAVHDWVYERGYYDVWENSDEGEAVLNKMNAALEPREGREGDRSAGPAERMRRLTNAGRFDAMDRRSDGD